MSSHPADYQVDVMTISSGILHREIDETRGNKSSLLLKRLDFVHMPDANITELFLHD